MNSFKSLIILQCSKIWKKWNFLTSLLKRIFLEIFQTEWPRKAKGPRPQTEEFFFQKKNTLILAFYFWIHSYADVCLCTIFPILKHCVSCRLIKGKKFAKKEEVAWCRKIPRDFFSPALLSKGHFYVKIHFSTRTIFSSAIKKLRL